ncbi:MAG: SMP-30/gluconolactonase/LRE family protein [Phycisphaeraceae bacterium]
MTTGNRWCVAVSIAALLALSAGCGSTHSVDVRSRDFTPPGGFTPEVEGPAVDADGNLYAVSFARKPTLGIVTPDGKASLFIDMPQGSTANGIRFDRAGTMYMADYTGHNVLRVDMKTKAVTVFAHNDKMNQPNDLAIMDNDILLASDPNWKESTGQLWRIDRDGSTHLLEANMGTTNGIEVSPDNKTLYVSESIQRNVWAYDLSPQGNISNKRLLLKLPDFGSDGMRCDAAGNLYLTRYDKGTVAIISPKGAILREVQLTGKKPSNIAFGGPDGRTCYVTMADRGNIETFRTDTPGRSHAMRKANAPAPGGK